tara:strand:+ start:715 stop:906 length:192 start_codon:yes stop_codon:yes gene_type:complete
VGVDVEPDEIVYKEQLSNHTKVGAWAVGLVNPGGVHVVGNGCEGPADVDEVLRGGARLELELI